MPIDLQRIFGEHREPRMRTVGPGAAELLAHFQKDPESVFFRTAQAFARTSRSTATAAILAEQIAHQAREAGAVHLEEVYEIFLVIVFVLAIDDQTDEVLDPAVVGVEGIDRYLEGIVAACRAGQATSDDAPTAFVLALTTRLRGRPAFSAYAPLYFDALAGMLDGMAAEFKQRGGLVVPAPREQAPSLDRYLETASRSVGLDLVLAVALIALGDSSFAQRDAAVRLATHIVSLICRLSNDIRSYERELAEGKEGALQSAARSFGLVLSAVSATEPSRAGLLDDVLRILSARMQLELCDLRDCLPYLEDSAGHVRAFMVDTAIGIVRLYEAADFGDSVQS